MAIPVAGLSPIHDPPARLYSTVDGGTSWTLVRGSLTDGTVPVASIQFTDRQDGWGLSQAPGGGGCERDSSGVKYAPSALRSI
jgi:hypothetical protein